jgi:hypothetical protein
MGCCLLAGLSVGVLSLCLDFTFGFTSLCISFLWLILEDGHTLFMAPWRIFGFFLLEDGGTKLMKHLQ